MRDSENYTIQNEYQATIVWSTSKDEARGKGVLNICLLEGGSNSREDQVFQKIHGSLHIKRLAGPGYPFRSTAQ
ncbi:hypothetical protein CEXT_63801 [Caerostris extrusa]|uniref:Uncharacterized protein n=1 Tax=Caerostris extrusa TaxID=172846 RepID=A0AAV4P7J7_CAEEX|nr:hypothetical protein CEXT_63801 [Caerostris extrusa]